MSSGGPKTYPRCCSLRQSWYEVCRRDAALEYRRSAASRAELLFAARTYAQWLNLHTTRRAYTLSALEGVAAAALSFLGRSSLLVVRLRQDDVV